MKGTFGDKDPPNRVPWTRAGSRAKSGVPFKGSPCLLPRRNVGLGHCLGQGFRSLGFRRWGIGYRA